MSISFTGLLESNSSSRQITVSVFSFTRNDKTDCVVYACRLDGKIHVQRYVVGGKSVPQKRTWKHQLANLLGVNVEDLVIHPVKEFSEDLSPSQILADLTNTPRETLETVAVTEIQSALKARGLPECNLEVLPRGQWNKELREIVSKPFKIRLVTQDSSREIARVFGSGFLRRILSSMGTDGRPVRIGGNDSARFEKDQQNTRNFGPPVLEYVLQENSIVPISVEVVDLKHAALDEPLGVLADLFEVNDSKSTFGDTLSLPENSDLIHAANAILALLVWEKIGEHEREIYQGLGFEETQIPETKPSQGARIAELLERFFAKSLGDGSSVLSQTPNGKQAIDAFAARLRNLKALSSRGGWNFLTNERRSRFGHKVFETHGGLQFSRSPKKLVHYAPGNIRDVDVQGFYSTIIKNTTIYLGAPQLIEPGHNRMTLAEAVVRMGNEAAGKDAWMIRVSGRITSLPNALIPSSNGAITNRTYRKFRNSKIKAGRSLARHLESTNKQQSATLYSQEICSGVVCWATWRVIQTLPPQAREEFERLEVDSILYYPATMVAKRPEGYDELHAKRFSQETPFTDDFVVKNSERVQKERMDHDSVALQVQIAELIEYFNRQRRRITGKNGESKRSKLMKLHSNTIYGVISSKHFSVNNVVASNVITATGRAVAFLMFMTLNGIQCITDGCTYRADQVPHGTFADWIKANPNYTIDRSEGTERYLDSKEIPLESKSFSVWLRQRIRDFFKDSTGSLDELLSPFTWEHKAFPETDQLSFDGLVCDGACNYGTFCDSMDGGGPIPGKLSFRGFPEDAKKQIFRALYNCGERRGISYRPILLESWEKIKVKKAIGFARDAFRRKRPADDRRILIPIGMDHFFIKQYKMIKGSAFIFKNAKQRNDFLKSERDFHEKHRMGLELLSLRRATKDFKDQTNKVERVCFQIFDWINRNEKTFKRHFNLARSCNEISKGIKHAHRIFKEWKAQLNRSTMRRLIRLTAKRVSGPPSGLFMNFEEFQAFAGA